MLFTILCILASACSGSKRSLKLEVNRQFATGNETFDGGLFVHGKSSTGKEFSFALADQTTAGITLDYGTWDIRVVGWDNSTEVFEGDVLCASKQITFSEDNQLEEIKVSNEACDQNIFAGAAYRLTTPSATFRELEVVTCGALYDPTTPVSLRSPGSLISLFCNDYPKALRKMARALTVSLDTVRPDGFRESGLTSNCIPAEETPTKEILTLKRIPTKIPVTIRLYDTVDCDEEDLIDSFRFPEGIEGGTSREALRFDHLLHPALAKLALPITSSQRASNFLGTEGPLLRCDNNTKGCVGLGSTFGADYILEPATPSFIRIPERLDCDTLLFTAMDATILNACQSKGAETFLLITPDTSLTEGAGSAFDIDGQPYTYVIGNGFLKSLRELAAIMSLDDAAEAQDSFGENPPEQTEDIGLSEVELFLSSAGISGLFWDQRCTTTPLPRAITRGLTRMEDGEERAYQVTLRNPPAGLTMPAYLAVAANPANPIPAAVFNRRFVVREVMPPALLRTRVVIDVACDNVEVVDLTGTSNIRMGRFERQKDFSEEGFELFEQNLVFWNTTDQQNARYEQFVRRLESDSESGTILRDHTRYIRSQKLPDAGTNHSLVKALSLSYLFERDLVDPEDPADDLYFEDFAHDEYALAPPYVTKTKTGFAPQNLGYRGTFTQPVFNEELSELRFQNFNPGRSLVRMADGRFVHSYSRASGFLHMEYFNGTTKVEFDDPMAPEEVWVGLSPDGTRAIVIATELNVIRTYVYDSGSGWVKTPTDLSSGNIIDRIRGEIDNTGSYLMGFYDDGLFSYAAGTSGTPATVIEILNQFTDPNDLIEKFSIVTSTEGFFFILYRTYFDGGSLYERTIASCKLLITTSDCTNLTEHYESTDDLLMVTKLSAERAANGTDFVIHAVAEVDPTLKDAIRVEVDGTTGVGVPTVTGLNLNFVSDSVFHFPSENQDMSTGASGTPDVTIDVPYISGGAAGLPLTFRALDPNTFSGRFTPPASFRGTN